MASPKGSKGSEASVSGLRHVKHVFLDLDGTLTDPREGIVRCIQHALSAAKNATRRYLASSSSALRFRTPSAHPIGRLR